MKKVLIIAITLAAVCAVIALTGCASTSKITEIDPATGKVTKITETSDAIAKQVIESTKNKTVYMWSKGWVAKMSAAAATTENPTPAVSMYAGNVDEGILTIHKEQNMANLPETIRACNASALSVSSNGINGSGGAASTAPDSGKAE